jgi:hypothetical protein
MIIPTVTGEAVAGSRVPSEVEADDDGAKERTAVAMSVATIAPTVSAERVRTVRADTRTLPPLVRATRRAS